MIFWTANQRGIAIVCKKLKKNTIHVHNPNLKFGTKCNCFHVIYTMLIVTSVNIFYKLKANKAEINWKFIEKFKY